MTTIDLLDKALQVAGAIGALLTVLGTVLPRSWALTQWAARIGPDLRGIHAPKLPPGEDTGA